MKDHKVNCLVSLQLTPPHKTLDSQSIKSFIRCNKETLVTSVFVLLHRRKCKINLHNELKKHTDLHFSVLWYQEGESPVGKMSVFVKAFISTPRVLQTIHPVFSRESRRSEVKGNNQQNLSARLVRIDAESRDEICFSRFVDVCV